MRETDPRLAYLLVTLATFAVYMPLMGGGFVWDDHLLIVDNPIITSLDNIPQMFATDLWGTTDVAKPDGGYYRPLMLVDLAISHALVGLNHSLYHLHNFLWHGVAVVLMMFTLERLIRDRLAAALGAAFFALHPVQIEVVGFISARNDPMAVVWLLLVLLLLSAKHPSRLALLGGMLASTAAILSKESVAFAPLMLAFAARARWGGWGRPAAHVALLLGFGLAVIMRWSAGVGMPAQADPERLAAVGLPSLAFYLEKLVWPIDIAPVIHFGWLPAVPWLMAGVAVAVLAVLAWLGGPFARAGLLFAFLGLLPAWAAVAHVGAIVDRYLYLPMVGVAWAVAAAAQRPLARKLIVLVLVGLTYAAAQQVPVWKNDATLWRAAIERAPSGYAKGALARWLEDQGKPKDAAFWYREAVVQAPMPFQESCFNVSRIHLKLNDPARAVEVGEEALTLGCEPSPELVAPLALAHALVGDWDAAIRRSTSVGRDPTGKAVVANLAARAATGDVDPLRIAVGAASKAEGASLRAQVMQVLDYGGADVEAIARALDGA